MPLSFFVKALFCPCDWFLNVLLNFSFLNLTSFLLQAFPNLGISKLVYASRVCLICFFYYFYLFIYLFIYLLVYLFIYLCLHFELLFDGSCIVILIVNANWQRCFYNNYQYESKILIF